MNGAIVWRCFWREYRMARGFWIAMLLLSLGMQLIWYLGNLLGRWGASPEVIQTMALVMPMFYVLAWAATAFNREHETGSFALLQGLPLTYLPLWLAKFGFTVLSSLLFSVAVGSVAAWLAGIPRDGNLALTLSIWLLWLIAIAGISSVCSQWIKRPLTAVFVAGGLLAVIALWPTDENTGAPLVGRVDRLANLIALVMAGLVAVGISLPQTCPWLHDQMSWWKDLPVRYLAQPSTARGSRRRTQLRRLAWISWRRLGAAGAVVLMAVLSMPVLADENAGLTTGFVLFAVIVWPVLLGTNLFYCEQDVSHARFLAGQGASPTRIWWLRQFMGAVIIVTVSVCLLAMYEVVRNSRFSLTETDTRVYWLYVPLAYLASQLVSVTIRSRLVAHAAAALLVMPLAAWAAFYTQVGVPHWIGFVIPSTTLLLASRLRVRPFLLEWNGLRHWLVPATVLIGGLTASAAAFVTYRATEIPWVEAPVDIGQFTRVADSKFNAVAAGQIRSAGTALSSHRWPSPVRYQGTVTAITDQWAQAIDVDDTVAWNSLPLPITPEEQTALAEGSELLTPELEQALESAHGLFHSSRWKWSATDKLHVGRLGRLLVMRARQRQADGDLSGAAEDYQNALRVALQLRRYDDGSGWATASQLEKLVADNLVFWAAAPDQAPERIASMIDWLVDWWRQEPRWVTPLQVEYTIQSRLVAGIPESLVDADLGLNPREAGWLSTLFSLPSERMRLNRLLRKRAKMEMTSFSSAVRDRMEGWSYALSRDAAKQWEQTTPMASVLSSAGEGLANLLAQDQLARTGLLLRLLLIRHRTLEGDYPAASVEGELPEQIANHAQIRLQQLTLGGSNPVPNIDRFFYRQFGMLPVRRAEQFVLFDEPLGSFVANAQGGLAVTIGENVYPLPATSALRAE